VSFSDGAHVELTPDRSMLCRPHDGKARFTPKPRQRLHLAGYMLRADRVESLCDGNVPAAIRPLIAPTTDRDILLKISTTVPLRRAAIRMFSNPFAGKLREVYLEGLALQLFALQSAAAGGDAKPRSSLVLSAAERKGITRAHARLLADLANPPTLAELAADAAMSERRLNAGFKALFGTTVFETLRKERLEHARLVLEREALPLKLVAERVGYRHVTNFINAFAARYGTPPRQFADGQTEPDRRPRAMSRRARARS
jgi:AraC-like DNA-binding protein